MSGRIRTIKPELLEDEKTSGLTDGAFRLFVGMILLADDHGNLGAHEKRLAASVFWNSRESRECSRELRELVATGLVSLYEVNEQMFAHLTGWGKHQRVDRPGKPRVPGPSHGTNIGELEDSRESRESVAEVSRDTREGPATDHDHDHDHDHEGEREGRTRAQEHAPAPPATARKVRRKAQAPAELPADWEPSESCLTDFRARGFDALGCLGRFRHYWTEGKGAGTKRADWTLTFWNWAEREAKDGRLPLVVAPPVPPPPREPEPEYVPPPPEFAIEMAKALAAMPKARSWEDA